MYPAACITTQSTVARSGGAHQGWMTAGQPNGRTICRHHFERPSHTLKAWRRLIYRGMLNLPEERREHRYDLEFGPNPVARPTVTKVFQGKRFVVFIVAGGSAKSFRLASGVCVGNQIGTRQYLTSASSSSNTRRMPRNQSSTARSGPAKDTF